MGSREEPDERPLRRGVIRKPFLIGRSELSQEAWDRIGGDDERAFKGADLPIDSVSWNDAQAWLDKAGDGLRLPSEAEWEYACRAGSTSRFGLGESLGFYDANITTGKGLSAKLLHGFPRNRSVAVNSYRTNAFGLLQVHGNLWEWCQDKDNDYQEPGDERPREPADGKQRIVRGGCWYNAAVAARSANRFSGNPSERNSTLGLRLAADIAKGR